MMLTDLLANFKASAIGCNTPWTETLFGPCRRPIKLRTLRSAKVMKATEIRTGTTKTTALITPIIVYNLKRLWP